MNKILAGLMGVATMIALSASAASAQFVDPTGGAFATATSDASTFVTTIVAPALIGLAATVALVLLALRYVRKIRSAGA